MESGKVNVITENRSWYLVPIRCIPLLALTWIRLFFTVKYHILNTYFAWLYISYNKIFCVLLLIFLFFWFCCFVNILHPVIGTICRKTRKLFEKAELTFIYPATFFYLYKTRYEYYNLLCSTFISPILPINHPIYWVIYKSITI